MRKYLISILLILLPENGLGQAQSRPLEYFNLSSQNFIFKRSMTSNLRNDLSINGGYIEHTQMNRLSHSWNWYYNLGINYGSFKTSDNEALQTHLNAPFHGGFGVQIPFIQTGTMHWILGLEGGSDIMTGFNISKQDSQERNHSIRLKSGFTINLTSLTGTNAEIQGLFSLPISSFNSNDKTIQQLAVIDGNLRIKLHPYYQWGLTGNLRFEDFEIYKGKRSYSNTRVFIGLFVDLQ